MGRSDTFTKIKSNNQIKLKKSKIDQINKNLNLE